jgi:hypothetical protein
MAIHEKVKVYFDDDNTWFEDSSLYDVMSDYRDVCAECAEFYENYCDTEEIEIKEHVITKHVKETCICSCQLKLVEQMLKWYNKKDQCVRWDEIDKCDLLEDKEEQPTEDVEKSTKVRLLSKDEVNSLTDEERYFRGYDWWLQDKGDTPDSASYYSPREGKICSTVAEYDGYTARIRHLIRYSKENLIVKIKCGDIISVAGLSWYVIDEDDTSFALLLHEDSIFSDSAFSYSQKSPEISRMVIDEMLKGFENFIFRDNFERTKLLDWE